VKIALGNCPSPNLAVVRALFAAAMWDVLKSRSIHIYTILIIAIYYQSNVETPTPITEKGIIMNHETLEIHEQPGKYEKIFYKEESYVIQGAVFEVYRVMGCGFLEAVYQECLEKELTHQNIPFQSQVQLGLAYKGEQLNQTYKPDFICYGIIIVELKAVKDIGDDHRAQMFNYLKATGMRLGLLVNFGHYPKATIERIVL
jgi:GxxExxY protein